MSPSCTLLFPNHLRTSEHLTRTCHPAVHSSVPQSSACLHTTGRSTGLPTHLYTPLFPNHFLFCVREGIPQSPGSAMLHDSSLLPCLLQEPLELDKVNSLLLLVARVQMDWHVSIQEDGCCYCVSSSPEPIVKCPKSPFLDSP